MLSHRAVKYGRNSTSPRLEARQLLLKRRHRPRDGGHRPDEGAILRTERAGALHQHAGNDLKTVGDAVMKFLKQNALFLQQASMEFF